MVVSIDPALAAHIGLSQRRPSVNVTILPTRAGVSVLRWTRIYTGAEADSPHALAIADRLIRARNDAGTLYTESTASITPSGSWVSTASATAGTGVALAAVTGEALLLYADSAGLKLQLRTSTDDGQTWSSATALVTEASAIGSIAASYNPNGDVCVFYTLGTGTTLKRLRRTSGVWAGSGTNWTRSGNVASLTGLAATHDGADFALLITGTEVTTANPRTWATRMGDLGLPANAWGSLSTVVAEADALSTTTFKGPGIAMVGQDVRGSFAVTEAGNVPFSRSFTSHPLHLAIVQSQWSEGEPHEAQGANGLALAYLNFGGIPIALATRPDGAWLATVPPTADLSERVISASYDVELERSRCRVLLDDHDHLVSTGFYTALFAGATVSILPGYLSAPPATQYGVTQDFTIDRITYEQKDGRLTATIEGIGAWELLERWRAPQAWQTAAGVLSRDAIFQRIAARAGVSWSHGTSPAAPSSDWSAYSPAFAIAAGESAGSVLKRLLAVVPDFVRASGSGLEVLGPTDSDSTAAAYSPLPGDLHYSAWSAVGEDASRPNWTRVQGPDRYADAFDFGAAGPHGVYQQGPILTEVRNLDATTNAKATSWAANALRRVEVERVCGQLVAPFHPGLQLLDRVTVSHRYIPAQAGHVVALGLRYERSPKGARYDVVLTIGGD